MTSIEPELSIEERSIVHESFAYNVLSTKIEKFVYLNEVRSIVPKKSVCNLAANLRAPHDLNLVGKSTAEVLMGRFYNWILRLVARIFLLRSGFWRVYDRVMYIFVYIAVTISYVSMSKLDDFYTLLEKGLFSFFPFLKIHLWGSEPSGFSDISRTTPPFEYSPRKICLVLGINGHTCPYPPVDQRISLVGEHVSTSQETDDWVTSERHSFVQKVNAHYEKEKSRLLSELAKFVVWSAMVPSVNEVTVYEMLGALWSVKSDFREVKDAILTELFANMKLAHPEERQLFPKIILTNSQTGDYIINNDDDGEEDVNGIIDSYGARRELIVRFSDSFKCGTGACHEESIDVELVIVPENISKAHLLDCYPGHMDHSTSNSLIYLADAKFSYKCFWNALHAFALETANDERF